MLTALANRLLPWRRPVIFPTLRPRPRLPMYEEEVRTVVTVAAAGDNVVLPAQNKWDVEILELVVQTSGTVSVAFKEKNFFMSPAWAMVATQVWSDPGKIVDRNHDLIVNLSAAVSTLVEVRWLPYFGRVVAPYYNQDGAKLQPVTQDSASELD